MPTLSTLYNAPRPFWITTGMIALSRVSFHKTCQEQAMVASDLSVNRGTSATFEIALGA
jgi:hypothetical protein